ncbi:hypothetical protein [Nocardia tengchongensis]|uniref:hypothetical protein n=1 Tax=Nocardia tengchongensis TaxID=2055889 RepID=UPI00367A43EA
MLSKNFEPERVTPQETPCPDCGERRVLVGGSLDMYLVRRNGGRPLSDLLALLCIGCGRVFFYADRLDRVRAAMNSMTS